MKKIIFIFIFAIGILSISPVHAEEESLRHAVAAENRISKRHQSEINIFGGDLLGDEWHNSWDVGAQYFFHINNTFAVGAGYMYSPIYTDNSSTFGLSLKTKNTHTIDGQVMISNDAAFRAGKSVIRCDFYLTLGGGTVWINEHYEPMGMIGGGLKVYTGWPWFAIRVDVNNYIHPTPNPTGDTINADIAFNAGVSFLFPARRAEEKKEEASPE
jgi:outer membrane beta-barrel protein